MSFVPERDPNDLYGPMGGNAEPAPSGGYKPGPETPHEVIMDAANKGFPPLPADKFAQLTEAEKQHLRQYVRRPLHPPRSLILSIATERDGGFKLDTMLKFNDLSSPTQAKAILDTLEELDARLSAALGYSPI